MPENTPDKDDALKALIAVNAAIRNLQLYPISSLPAQTSIDKALQAVRGALGKRSAFSVGESEKRLLVNGHPVAEKDLAKPQIAAFLQLMLNYELKSLTFEAGLKNNEFERFLSLFTRKGSGIPVIEAFRKALSEAGFRHIRADQRIWKSVDADEAAGGTPSVNLETDFTPMLHTLDFLLIPENKEVVSRKLAESIATKDDGMVTTVLTRGTEGEMGQRVFEEIMKELDAPRFERLMMHMKRLHDQARAENADPETAGILQRTFRTMIRMPQGRLFRERLQARKAREEDQRKRNAAHLRAGLGRVLNEDIAVFKDPRIMAFLPTAVRRLLVNDQEKAAEAFLERMADGLKSSEREIRDAVSAALVTVVSEMNDARRKRLAARFIPQVADWLEFETATTDAYDTLMARFGALVHDLMLDGRSPETYPFLDALRNLSESADGDRVSKARIALKHIADDTLLDHLLEILAGNGSDERNRAVADLVHLGRGAAPRLLGLLKRSDDRFERSRIMGILTEMGGALMPRVSAGLTADGPWYYLRNLIRLLGKIGSPEDAERLIPFLANSDVRVQRECLNTLYLIGEEKREAAFTKALSVVDPELRVDVIRIVGRLKCRSAVPKLLEMLADKNSFKANRNDPKLAEVICIALGYIGDPVALPALQELAAQKTAILDRHPDVRAAATRATSMLSTSRIKSDSRR